MFRMIREYFDRRRVASLFGKHVSKAVARELLKSGALPRPAHEERLIEYAYVSIPAADVSSFSHLLEIVTQIAERHGGICRGLLPILEIGFGLIGHRPIDGRLRFVAEVRLHCSTAAIVHGCARAQIGTFGNAHRLEYGAWWPGQLQAVQRLAALAPGEIRELSPNT